MRPAIDWDLVWEPVGSSDEADEEDKAVFVPTPYGFQILLDAVRRIFENHYISLLRNTHRLRWGRFLADCHSKGDTVWVMSEKQQLAYDTVEYDLLQALDASIDIIVDHGWIVGRKQLFSFITRSPGCGGSVLFL